MRRAGMGRTPDGLVAWWSVAEGGRGRRWREAVTEHDGLRHSLLLETDPNGRFAHLELATASGLLTLHPEPDGTLHGNAVEITGVRHVTGLPWETDGVVLVDGSLIAPAAAAHAAGDGRGGGALDRPALRIDPGLALAVTRVRLVRLDDGRLRLDGADVTFAVDADGLPLLADAITWPLELDPG